VIATIVLSTLGTGTHEADTINGGRGVEFDGDTERLYLPKMLSGANAFEISDIERMNIGAHQPGL
jgi:hypothetical protein